MFRFIEIKIIPSEKKNSSITEIITNTRTNEIYLVIIIIILIPPILSQSPTDITNLIYWSTILQIQLCSIKIIIIIIITTKKPVSESEEKLK